MIAPHLNRRIAAAWWASLIGLLLFAACTVGSWQLDPQVLTANQRCRELSGPDRQACIEGRAVARQNPDICRLAGSFAEQACLQAVYETIDSPDICSRVYLPDVAIGCRTFYAHPTPTATASATFTPTATATPTPTATSPPTPDPYAGLAIPDLRARSYGQGMLQIVRAVADDDDFTRYQIRYPSDGLEIHGFMDVPKGGGRFPVVLVLHSYPMPDGDQPFAYMDRYGNQMVRAGYLVLHPNLRAFLPSNAGVDSLRADLAIDVLNLIAIVQRQGGLSGPLEKANPATIGLWGHGIGGGIALHVSTVIPGLRAVVLYAPTSGDESWTKGEPKPWEQSTPGVDLRRISPLYHLDRITAALSIHHGQDDEIAPVSWSVELCERLQMLRKPIECYVYPGQPHVFGDQEDQRFMSRMVDFFNRYFKNP